jgi:lipopolysaccharide biosynthesis regulator YciM
MNMNELTMFDMAQLFTEIYSVIADQEGELIPEVENKLQALFEKAATKADSAQFIISKYENDADYYKLEAKKYTAMARKCENVVDKVKERLISMMEAANLTELQGNNIKVKMSDTAGEIIVDNVNKLPPSCITVRTEANKTAIRVMLQKGEVPGAHLQINKSIKFSVKK